MKKVALVPIGRLKIAVLKVDSRNGPFEEFELEKGPVTYITREAYQILSRLGASVLQTETAVVVETAGVVTLQLHRVIRPSEANPATHCPSLQPWNKSPITSSPNLSILRLSPGFNSPLPISYLHQTPIAIFHQVSCFVLLIPYVTFYFILYPFLLLRLGLTSHHEAHPAACSDCSSGRVVCKGAQVKTPENTSLGAVCKWIVFDDDSSLFCFIER